jgi:hypothetical protein
MIMPNTQPCAPGSPPLHTYSVVAVATGQWAVEWWANSVAVRLVPGAFETKLEALVTAFNLTRLEWDDAPRPRSAYR